MAEKNSAQTNRQTDKQTDTTKIMVTWPWTKNIQKKLQRKNQCLQRQNRNNRQQKHTERYAWTSTNSRL